MKSSKVCTDNVLPSIVRKKVKDMRKDEVCFMPGVPVPRALPYDRLLSYINGINMGTVNDLEVCHMILQCDQQIQKLFLYDV